MEIIIIIINNILNIIIFTYSLTFYYNVSSDTLTQEAAKLTAKQLFHNSFMLKTACYLVPLPLSFRANIMFIVHFRVMSLSLIT